MLNSIEYDKKDNVKGKRMRKKIKKCCLFLTVFAAVILTFHFTWQIEVDESIRTVEYGEILSREPDQYANGFGMSLFFCKLDFSGVDETKVGEYELLLHHGMEEYRIPVIIKDTKAPVIIKKKKDLCYEVGTQIELKDLVAEVQDSDPEVSLVAKEGKKEYKELLYEQTGKFSVLLEAEDTSGNKSSETIEFSVDTAPEFYGVQDFYIAKRCKEVSYSAGVEAIDLKDGNITDDIIIKSGTVDLNQNGNYEVVYEVTDSDGLKEELSVKAHVMEKEELEEKIGNREINWREEKIFGAENRYDAGACVTDTLQEQLKYLLPTEVHLYFVYPDNPNIIDSSGSGFIIYMDVANIYICTNYHVIAENGEGCCYFYNGENAAIETVGANQPYDIAVLKVQRKDISEETYKNLMTVHLNRDEFEIAKNGGKPVFIQKLNKQGVEYCNTGETISFGKIPFRLLPEIKTMASDLEAYYGSSGSAVMDYEGNLIGMVSGFEDYETGRVFHEIGLTDVIQKFTEITGINLYSE